MQFYIYILNSLELFTFLTGVYFFRKLVHTPLKYFVLLLGFIFFSEMAGMYLKSIKQLEYNKTWFGFIVIPVQYFFYFWLYRKQARSRLQIAGHYFLGIIYLSILIYEFVRKNQDSIFSLSYMFGTLFLLIMIFNYLYNYIKHDELIQIKSTPLFYISIGLLIFYVGSFPFYGLHNYLWTQYQVIGYNYWYVATTLNCIMYCMFTISFLCNHKQKYT